MVVLENIEKAYKAQEVSPRIYDFIRQQEKDPANKGHNGVVVVGLNSGREIVDVVEGMFEEDDNAPHFSLLSVEADPLDIGDDYQESMESPLAIWKNDSSNLDGKLVILVDYAIKTGKSAFFALNELVSLGRPKYTRLVVVEDTVGERNYPIQPDKKLPL